MRSTLIISCLVVTFGCIGYSFASEKSKNETISVNVANMTNIKAPNATNINAPNATKINAPNATTITAPNATNVNAPNATNITVLNATNITALNVTNINQTQASDPLKLLEKALFTNKTYKIPKRIKLTYTSKSVSLAYDGLLPYIDITGDVKVTWESEMKWNVSEYNVTSLELEFRRVARPYISFQSLTLIAYNNVTISPNGTVSWSTPIEGTQPCRSKTDYIPVIGLKCLIQLEYFPHILNVEFNVEVHPTYDNTSLYFNGIWAGNRVKRVTDYFLVYRQTLGRTLEEIDPIRPVLK